MSFWGGSGSEDLSTAIRKATSPDESAPKRKHVRVCIVYTWDNRTSRAFWSELRLQPIQQDEVQTFKALITIHKVLQEGHPSTLTDAIKNIDWIRSLTKGVQGATHKGYHPLIRGYVDFLLKKLQFHKNHPEFNGTFEYEEYVSLKATDDPNEGYESIVDLMTLQDEIDAFCKEIFARFVPGSSNECRISSLVPFVAESYGIYKFITSMLRAMYSVTASPEALQHLRERYELQHHRLLDFYHECSSLRYLNNLITIPRLSNEPPNLEVSDGDDAAPPLPDRGAELKRDSPISTPSVRDSANHTPLIAEPTGVNDFWTQQQQMQQQQQQQQFEEEQRRIQDRIEQERQQQQMLALQQQQEFERQQQQQAEQQRLAQEHLMREQVANQARGRMAELERDILALQGQYNQDQLMLEQYDRRVKALEAELQNLHANGSLQLQSKDEQIKALQEQINTWKTKYDALAKLYSQIRQEHLDLLARYKTASLKASSAQEAVSKREKLERDLKAKNLELAGLIRERDRARHELDRSKSGNQDEIDKLKRELRISQDDLDKQQRSKGSELSDLLSKHNREINDLEDQLRAKQRQLDSLSTQSRGISGEAEDLLKEKEEELEVYKAGMDEALLKLNELQMNSKDTDAAMDDQIDTILVAHLEKLKSLIDAVLISGAERIQDALHELESPMQGGNTNASASYLLSVVEKASSTATDFATAFNNYVAEGPNGDYSEIIKTVAVFSGAISDVLLNAKGITRFAPTEKAVESILNAVRESARAAENFLNSLLSNRIVNLSDDKKTDRVINGNVEVQKRLQTVSRLAETYAPKTGVKLSGDLGQLVDKELHAAAEAIEKATAKLNNLLGRPKDPTLSAYDLQVNEAILSMAISVTSAIAALIQAATDSQHEIVAEGRGSSSRTAFYKKHNRWTEGLISAAKAVAQATNILIETADGVINGTNSLEQLIVASNQVSSSTAQLVAASRVRASFMSKTQDRLESASKAVNSACRLLVNKVQEILRQRGQEDNEKEDYSSMSSHETKTREMEQQVEILKLENELSSARHRLGEIRKFSYRQDDSD